MRIDPAKATICGVMSNEVGDNAVSKSNEQVLGEENDQPCHMPIKKKKSTSYIHTQGISKKNE